MPRQRSVADSVLLDEALAVMGEAGPDAVTFQAVAARAGLSAATLVQRFGSKRDMLRAALRRAWDQLDAATADADAAAPATPAGAVAMLVALSGGFGEGDDLGEGLLVLREDFRDRGLRACGARWMEALALMLGRRLGGKGGPRPDLGRLMVAQWQGAVIVWGFTRGGPLKGAVRSTLEAWCTAVGLAAEEGEQGIRRRRPRS